MRSSQGFSRKYAIILAVLLLLIAAELIFFGTKKEGYHIDEMYMYGTANSEYLPFPHLNYDGYRVKDWMLEYGPGESLLQFFRNMGRDFSILKKSGFHLKDTEIYSQYLVAKANSNDMYRPGWVTGDFFRDYVSASKSNTFNYFSVVYNFRRDTHPLLYGALLHTVSSFAPGVFSKWFGLGLNLCITLLTVSLLYVTVRNYLGGRLPAILVAACYGLSAAAGDIALYIRMYSLLTLMVVGSLYAHLRLRESGWEWTKQDRRVLIFFTVFGYLTQYYFVFIAFGIAVASVISMAIRKKKKSIVRYILTMAVSGVIGIVVWPFSIKAVFGGTRTGDTFGALFNMSDTFYRLKVMLNVLTHHTLGVPGWIFPCLLLAIVAVLLTVKILKKERGYSNAAEKAALLATPVAVYFLVVSKVAPYLVDRYIMCLFPWVSVFVICGMYLLVRRFVSNGKVRTGLIIGFVLLLAFSSNALRLGNNHLYSGGQETDHIDGDTDCVYILPPGWWNESVEDILLLMQCKDVAVVRANELELLAGTYSPKAGRDLLIIVRDGAEADTVDYVLQNFIEEGNTCVFTEQDRGYGRGRTLIRYRVE
ncbi:MAG: hypothetical protein ILP13_03095 [Lachnospiraceae bacterium]|nr:hypothetical protein [Lachnospiraceae bacterium]